MFFKPKRKYVGKHVLVTGGSSGIGLAIAKEFRKQGAHVSLLARNPDRLATAKDALLQITPSGDPSFKPQVYVISVDVSDYDKVQAAVAEAVSKQGLSVDVLVCSAGFAQPGMFKDHDLSIFRSHMDINYFGVVNAVKAVLNEMRSRGSGQICVVSSVMGMMGFAGYAAYASSKHALIGLADCLRNELQGTGVQVSLCLPPDTDTPGFEEENKTKPEVTRIISEGTGLFKSDRVAECAVRGMARGDYILPCPDFLLTLMITSVLGFRPRSFPGVLWDMLVGLITPLVYWPWLGWADNLVAKHNLQQRAAA